LIFVKTAAVLLMLAAIALELLGGDSARETLRYERTGVADGEYWRLATGHLVHAGWAHLAVNVLTAAALALVLGRFVELWALGACVAGTSAGLYFLSDVDGYVGASGVLHGLLAYAMLGAVRKGRSAWWIGLALLAVKIGWEQWRGPLPWSESTAGVDVIVDAHLYGAVAGLLASVRWIATRR